MVAVFDEEDGRLLAIMDAGRLTAIRTAATATRPAGARPRCATVAVIGTGVQARAQLELLAALPRRTTSWSAPATRGGPARTPPSSRTCHRPIREAVRDADAVFCCTGATPR